MLIIIYNHHFPLANNSLKLISGILLLQFKKWRVREKRGLLHYIQDLILLRHPGSDRSHLSPGFLHNLCLLSLFLSLLPSPHSLHHSHPKIATWVVLLETLSQITYFLWSKSFNVSALFLKVKVKTFTMACKVLQWFGPYPLSDLLYTCCPSGYSASAILASLWILNMTSMVLPQELCTSARSPLPIIISWLLPSSPSCHCSNGNFYRGLPWPPYLILQPDYFYLQGNRWHWPLSNRNSSDLCF